VSFLPILTYQQMAALGYEHIPQQPITKTEYDAYVSNLLPLDLSSEDQGEAERFCDNGVCALPVR